MTQEEIATKFGKFENHLKAVDHRIDELKEDLKDLSDLTSAVAKLATNMEHTTELLKQQGQKIEAFEKSQDEKMTKLENNIENRFKQLETNHDKRLDSLEQEPLKEYRNVKKVVISAIVTAVVGAVIGAVMTLIIK